MRWDAQSSDGVRTVSISRGDTVDLAGWATSADGTPAAGVTVVLKRGPFDGRTTPSAAATTWSEASQATTRPDGTFHFGVAPTQNSVFRAESADAAATSASYPVVVRSAVTIRIGTRAFRTVPDGSKTRLSGTVTDSGGQAVPDLPVTIDRRRVGGSWTPYSSTRTIADGSFRFLASSSTPQHLLYRARSAATDTYEAGVSGSVDHEARHDPFDAAQINRMIRYVKNGGLKVGVGLVDRKTGRTYNYGRGQSTFYTASVAKVMVAMDVLRDDHNRRRTAPSSANGKKISSMIRNSNDAITWSYWRSRGGSKVVARVNKLCGTSIRVYSNTWSMSRPSPVQMARVLDCLADGRALNPKLSSFLMYQMRNVTPSQRWGIPKANPDRFRTEMNKNGWWRWPCCYFWTVNSTGLFGAGNRYAFTVFTQYGGSLPQSRGERQAQAVTGAMFPWGTIIY